MSENGPAIEKLEKQIRVLQRKLERSEWHRVDLENQHDRDQHLYKRLHADLEAARRAAEVEAALERVRSQAMAMRKPEALSGISEAVFTELKALGLTTLRNTEIVINHDTEESITSYYYSDYGVTGVIDVAYNANPILAAWAREMQQADDAFAEIVIAEDDIEAWRAYRLSLGYVPDPRLDAASTVYYYSYSIGLGALSISSFEPVPAEQLHVLAQFRNVFNLAYQRYVDIARAEAQAREAERQAALDRVRAEIASMRTAADLERITPLVWRELTTLGVPFFRCGVFIIDEAAEAVQVFLTTPEGKALAVLHLGFDDAPLVTATVAHWRQDAVYIAEWEAVDMQAWTAFLHERGLIQTPVRYLDAEVPPEHLALHFVPFAQGMLYVGSREPLRAEDLGTVQALADAFAVAYARYEDFQRLEAKNQEVEAALADLKITQQQLVHSEKMASLGALTAGIAHEIKNPLNFITNFAEVNDELADELREDLAGHPDALATVEDLLADLKQNARVIVQHGKRADSIVKSMMAHARESSGERQAADLNALIEEHVELAYHGKRAQVPGFTVEVVTDYDERIGRVDVVPQEIGRVLLNLLGNAFDAVSEERTAKGEEERGKREERMQGSPMAPVGTRRAVSAYQPTVTVSTRRNGDTVEIRLSDNGPGIPAEIKEKIFEPFFTTKPTGSGTGLGLSLSYDIVTKGHGGTLTVESTEGEGTTFVVALPAR